MFKKKNTIKKQILKKTQKKGCLEKTEKSFLKLSRIVWRKKKSSISDNLEKLLGKTKPLLNLKNVRLRGTTLKIPHYIEKEKQLKLGLNWISSSSRKSKIFNNLMENILISKETILEYRKKFHETANQNKVFAHNRWF